MMTIKFEGKELTLKSSPIIYGNEDVEFQAFATDEQGNEYEVKWELVENWKELAEYGDDEILVADWDTPSSVEEI